MTAGNHIEKRKKGGAKLLAAAAIVILVLAAAAAAALSLFTFAGGRFISRSAAEVELKDAGIDSVAPLLRMKAPDIMDLRGNDIDTEDYRELKAAFPDCQIMWDVPLGGVGEVYDSQSESVAVPVYHPDKAELYALMPNLKEIDLRGAVITAEDFEALRAAVPGCRIIWSIPIGGQYFDSTAESLEANDFTLEEVEKFKYFENLKSVDARGGDSYEAYQTLEKILPDCAISWDVALGSIRAERSVEGLELIGSGATAAELMERLGYFPDLWLISLGEGFARDEMEALRAAFPGMSFGYELDLCGKTVNCLDTSIDLGSKNVSAEELIANAWNFTLLEEMNLAGCGLSTADLTAIAGAYPGVSIRADVELYGKTFFTDAVEIDLSGIEISDTSVIENALVLFPDLEKVIMSNCGISDEDMDALNCRHEDVHFVWTLRFSVYTVRTDVTAFCASNVPGYVAPKLTDSELAPIKYLRSLEALDLGHMYYSDLSFLENMPNLRYLILVEANYRDISAIASLENLYYLELFNNTINDISPLLECKNLRHLNLGFTRGYDPTCLEEMNWLERLWYPGGVLSADQISSIESALTDTDTYFAVWDGDGSTGGGWREHESYFVMRDMFNMHYMPGGTGVPGAEE